jgi:hypothetical protein
MPATAPNTNQNQKMACISSSSPTTDGSYRAAMFDRSTAVIAMDSVFFILFGMVAGLFLLPRLQRLADQVRRRLDELDQLDRTRGPAPGRRLVAVRAAR